MWQSISVSLRPVCKISFICGNLCRRLSEVLCSSVQVLLAHGSSPSTRLTPAPTTCPKPTRGKRAVNVYNNLIFIAFVSVVHCSNVFFPPQLQSDRHSSLRALRQTVRQVAHSHRGDVRLCCRVSHGRVRRSSTTTRTS